ncbi:hypothetical protein DENSPDRAFT_667546 [Dentipellis sp. KUC8613]|nr:hypothetical protein DENSPDRAFT_667546 [Dentipellis sp. KUC8613]
MPHQYSIPQTILGAHGAFELTKPDPGASFAPHAEQFPLRSRPLENVYLRVAQVPLGGTYDLPDLYAAGIGSSSGQRYYSDVPLASYAPPAPLLHLPQHWSPETIPFGFAASPTVPRSLWVPDDGARYEQHVYPTPAAVNPAHVHGGYFPQAPSFDGLHARSHYGDPSIAPMPPFSMALLGAQPPTQAYPMPGYGEGPPHGGLNTANVPYGTFQPDQQMDSGRMDTSLRQTSSYKLSRIQRREGTEPFPRQAARPGRKARETLGNDTHRTQGDDLGYKSLGQYTTECLHAPSQGPHAPPPTTEARASKTTSRNERTQKTQSPAPAPLLVPAAVPAVRTTRRRRRRRCIPREEGDPAAIEMGNGKWGCPHPGCGKDFTRARDAERHWSSLHKGVLWLCLTCGTTVTRSDNLPRHYEAIHHRDELDGEVVLVLRNEVTGQWTIVTGADAGMQVEQT